MLSEHVLAYYLPSALAFPSNYVVYRRAKGSQTVTPSGARRLFEQSAVMYGAPLVHSDDHATHRSQGDIGW